ncbi:hypothetical protein CYLTODRAFT_424920 [Cylindrobasidium torrendii FP15055 ss-10]|uniref:Uncharacterized protein n=1 Tax=Cylindrobasidium torrendii FP15055 ss-10 TaxID=1314674 RepID=A0A0D7B2S4_9AGAR|nr:hypothetical protein CYLTODRAFT_424920 [Cylindrobasidium torrendii FP15055 ss-10]
MTCHIETNWQTCSSDCPCPQHILPSEPPKVSDTFDALRHSNDSLSCTEEKTVRESLLDLELSIDKANAICDELAKAEKALAERRMAWESAARILQSARQDHIRVLHPIRKLSAEVLAHIFSLARPLPAPGEPDLGRQGPSSLVLESPVNPLWSFALTCRRWKEIVFGTPGLWSQLTIDVRPDNFYPGSMAYSRRTSLHLRYSCLGVTSPLEVTIGSSDMNATQSGDLPPIIYALPAFATTIVSMTLFIPPSALPSLLLVQGQLPNLVTAVVANPTKWTDSFVVQRPVALFESCQKLKTLRIANFPSVDYFVLPPHVEDLTIQHHAIVDSGVDLVGYAMVDAFTYLRPSTQIRTLHLDVTRGEGTTETISLPHLEHLSATANTEAGLIAFLDSLDVPKLTSLHLRSGQSERAGTDGGAAFYDAILRLVYRSGCPLTTLHLNRAPHTLRCDILHQFCLDAPFIEELLIFRRKNAARIVDSICGSLAEGYLPALRTLIFKLDPFDDAGLNALAAWIERRVANGQKSPGCVDLRWYTGMGSVGSEQLFASFRNRLAPLELDVRTSFTEQH